MTQNQKLFRSMKTISYDLLLLSYGISGLLSSQRIEYNPDNVKLKQIYKMKAVSLLFLLSCSTTVVEAFNSSPTGSRRHRRDGSTATKLDAATLALSFEEDLALTRQIIMDHQERSATVSKEQFIQQMEELIAKPSVAAEIVVEKVDISVPYDAAARLAYESMENKNDVSFDTFEAQYLLDAVALVKSKQPDTESVADDANTKKEKKALLQPVVTWLWKKVSPKK